MDSSITRMVDLRKLAQPMVYGMALVGMALLYLATNHGAGTSPDSAAYLGAAQNLLLGKGLTVPFGETIDGPLLQFPPLYPLLLAAAGWSGVPVAVGARWLQIVLFGVNILLVSSAIRRISPPGSLAPLVGGMAFTLSPGILRLHSMVWSEGLFLALSLASLLCLARYLEDCADRWLSGWLAAALVLGCLASLTRYAGAALLAAGGLGLWWLGRANRLKSLVHGLVYSAIGFLPLALLGIVHTIQYGSSTNRTFGVHPVGLEQVKQVIDTMAAWFLLPVDRPFTRPVTLILGILIGLILVWAVLRHSRQGGERTADLLLKLLGIFSAVYAAFVIASFSFLDANIPLDERILAPLYVSGLVLALFGYQQVRSSLRGGELALAGLVALFVVSSAWAAGGLVKDLFRQGAGLTSSRMTEAGLVQAIQVIYAGAPLYSNAPEAVYLQTGHPALRLPKKVELLSGQVNENFHQDMQTMNGQLVRQGGAIVYFHWARGKTIPDERELQQYLPLKLAVKGETGDIFIPITGGQ